MKFRIWMMLVVLLGVFAVAACGGGNDTEDADGGECSSDGEETEPTAAELRQAQIDKLVAAFEKYDGDKVTELFHTDDHELVKERIVGAFDELKSRGEGYFHIEPGEIVEEDDRFVLPVTLKFGVESGEEQEEKKLEIVEHEGQWVFKFYD